MDLPDVGDGVVRRVLAAGGRRDVLARASYDGVAGHPVLLGRGHWAGVLAVATGDRGARDYLSGRDVLLRRVRRPGDGARRGPPRPALTQGRPPGPTGSGGAPVTRG